MSSLLLIGNPNSGKTLLFNRLTGLSHKVANFPGVTVQVSKAKSVDDPAWMIFDFPGIYSTHALTRDEEIAIDQLTASLKEPTPSCVVCVLDSTRLERSLYFGIQALELARSYGKPLVFAANMLDELNSKKVSLRAQALSEALGAPVVLVSARTGEGLNALRKTVGVAIQSPAVARDAPKLTVEQTLERAHQLAREHGPSSDILLLAQNKIDRVVLSSLGGGLIFLALMALLFQSIFSWATPLMNLIEVGVGSLGESASRLLPAGIAADFLKDAVFGGFGSFLVFVPQIFVLTLLIGFLEDSGYLARAAVICHRPLSLFGLSGRSFVPLLSGFACAIPALYAARTIESPRRRLLTVISIPLMTCSARLPVYALLIATLIPAHSYLGGLVGLQGLVLFAIYLFGLFTALLVSAVLSKSTLRRVEDAPFVLELPPYRVPALKPLMRNSFTRAWAFVRNAGAVIFTVNVVVWILGYFPGGSGHLETSWLAHLGKWIDPIFQPLGMDWKFGVAILASFVAREVFVGTLGTLFGIESASENVESLAHALRSSGLSLASGLSLLVFYAIALQCASTLSVMRRETGGWKIPLYTFVSYSLLAYTLAALTYLLTRTLSGFSL